jgi:hypothetical protein
MDTGTVSILQRSEIDIGKWDTTIQHAKSSLIYGYSFYLDNMATNWSALIIGDYEVVMPLPFRKKWGISYLYQPAFTQQLGMFSSRDITAAETTACLLKVRQHFKFAEIYINYLNNVPGSAPRQNLIIELDRGYDHVRSNYKKDLLKNLKLAESKKLLYAPGDLDTSLENYRRQYAKRVPHVTDRDYKAFGNLCRTAAINDELIIRAVSDETGKPVCSALLIQKANRLVLLQSYNSSKGRSYHANHFLIDRLIREFSTGSFILDFEASDIPAIAHFYSNYGAVNQPYYFYKYNLLPWWIRLFKK